MERGRRVLPCAWGPYSASGFFGLQINRLIAEKDWENRKTQKPFHVEYEVLNGQFVK